MAHTYSQPSGPLSHSGCNYLVYTGFSQEYAPHLQDQMHHVLVYYNQAWQKYFWY
jgi:hypothetical protein